MNTKVVGKGLARLEGALKVTGKARYAAEFPLEKMTYAVAVGSTISSGTVRKIDLSKAIKYKGVLTILTPENCPSLNVKEGTVVSPSLILKNNVILHAGQYVVLVIAESLESATEASRLVKIEYDEKTPVLALNDQKAEKYPGKVMSGPIANRSRGDAEAALKSAAVKIDSKYTTPGHNHNPMEMHSVIASWDGDKLTVYDGNQNPAAEKNNLAKLFGIPPANVRILSKFLGGAFGGKSYVWPHISLAAVAAKQVNRPVKFVVNRKQQFANVGRRSPTQQRIAMGADRDGTLKTIIHEGSSDTAMDGEFVEQFTIATPMLYSCPSIKVAQEVVRTNKIVPTYMRAPGEATGVWALESAMDELAHELKMDPLEFRMKNYAKLDPEHNREFSSKSLDKCYALGAEKFGWDKRPKEVLKLKRNGMYVGMGMATATRGAKHFNCSVSAALQSDGKFVFKSSTIEQGAGTITVMTQIAADWLSVPLDAIDFELGDTDFPSAPVAAGSATVTTVGNGVVGAAQKLQAELAKQLSGSASSPFKGIASQDISFADGKITAASTGKSITYVEALRILNLPKLEVIHDTSFNDREIPYSMHGFGAHFAEVLVDPDLGILRVSRMVSVMTCGKVMNERTCRSQIEGGVIWGISMALHEETVLDKRHGRVMNDSFAGYHIPVNMDIPKIESYIVDEEDKHLGPLGAKGIGELGMAGVPAAIVNALFNATGKRVRDLPLTPDKIML